MLTFGIHWGQDGIHVIVLMRVHIEGQAVGSRCHIILIIDITAEVDDSGHHGIQHGVGVDGAPAWGQGANGWIEFKYSSGDTFETLAIGEGGDTLHSGEAHGVAPCAAVAAEAGAHLGDVGR